MSTVYHTTNCNWLPLNNFLFQIANVLLVFSYFVPDNLNGLFLLRFFLGTAGLFFALWGWMILCAPDTFGWNVFFMVGNYIHALYLFIHIKRPRKFPEECELVYETLFEPIGVQRFQFQKLVKASKIEKVQSGDFYGRKNQPAERVSILLQGRVDVTDNGHIVHVTKPLEFLDSPEWASGEPSCPASYDVSLVAHEDIKFLSWNHRSLHKLLKKEKFLKNVFESIVGQDVTKKLLSLTRNLTQHGPGNAPFRAGSILYLHHEIIEAGRAISKEDVTKDQVDIPNPLSAQVESTASPTYALDVDDCTPLVYKHPAQFDSHPNGISLHDAVKMFVSPTSPLIQDDLFSMDDRANCNDEEGNETVL